MQRTRARRLASLPRRLIRQSGIQATTARAGLEADRLMRHAARTGRPVVVGPWLAEVGFEVLYWIPFVHQLRAQHGLAPEQLIILSRGNTAAWYGASCGTGYVDLYELFEPTTFDRLQHERVTEAGGQKHMSITSLDRQALERLQARLDVDDPLLLHPSYMFRRFRPFWMRRRSLRAVLRDLRFEAPAPVPRVEGLPDDYVAVKLYGSDCLPATPEVRERLAESLRSLSGATELVLLDVPVEHHDHPSLIAPTDLGRTLPGATVPAQQNLAWQTAVLSHARALVGTYGGFSYLAPLYGVPAVGLYWEANFSTLHGTVLERMLRSLGRGPEIDVELVDLRTTPSGYPFVGAA